MGEIRRSFEGKQTRATKDSSCDAFVHTKLVIIALLVNYLHVVLLRCSFSLDYTHFQVSVCCRLHWLCTIVLLQMRRDEIILSSLMLELPLKRLGLILHLFGLGLQRFGQLLKAQTLLLKECILHLQVFFFLS